MGFGWLRRAGEGLVSGGGSEVLGYLGVDLGDPTGDKAAAQQQYDAQVAAVNSQERIAQDAQDWLTERSDYGIGMQKDYGAQGIGALQGYGDIAQGYIGAGQANALGAMADRYGNAQSQLSDAYGQAQSGLRSSYGMGFEQMGDLRRLQGYEQGAARGVNTYGRQDAMLDQGLYSGFQADPGYQFRQQQGEDAINRAAAARGGRLSGRTLQELGEFNSGLASQEFGNYAARQQAAAGIAGQTDASRNAAALQAQQNQMAMAQTGYGAQGNLANMYADYGRQYAGMQQQYGGAGAALQSQQGDNLSNIYMQGAGMASGSAQQTGTNIGQGYMNLGSNLANTAIGTAGNQTSLAQNMMGAYQNFGQYGGMVAQAQADQRKQAGMAFLAGLSDERLKTDIKTIHGSRYERIGLRGCSWKWNDTARELGMHGVADGVIAQEVIELYPEAVIEGPSGYFMVNYGELERLIAEAA